MLTTLAHALRPLVATNRLSLQRSIASSAAARKASEPAPAEEEDIGPDSAFHTKIWEVLKLKEDDLHRLWISKSDSVFDAVKKMTARGVGSLLVYDPSLGEEDGDHPTTVAGCCGIITERDYMNKVVVVGKSSMTTDVKDIMTPRERLRLLTPNHTVLEAMNLMVHSNVRHVPVIDSHAMVGVLSMRDVMRALLEDQKHEIDALKDYIHGTY